MIKDPIVFINHIFDSIKSIESFSKGLSKSEFFKDEIRQNAIIRKLEIIGEATKNLNSEFRSKYPQVEWQKISGLRDKLIHDYFGINLERIWNIMEKDLPNLKITIQNILNGAKKALEENKDETDKKTKLSKNKIS